jgi:hypothetical protein
MRVLTPDVNLYIPGVTDRRWGPTENYKAIRQLADAFMKDLALA